MNSNAIIIKYLRDFIENCKLKIRKFFLLLPQRFDRI